MGKIYKIATKVDKGNRVTLMNFLEIFYIEIQGVFSKKIKREGS